MDDHLRNALLNRLNDLSEKLNNQILEVRSIAAALSVNDESNIAKKTTPPQPVDRKVEEVKTAAEPQQNIEIAQMQQSITRLENLIIEMQSLKEKPPVAVVTKNDDVPKVAEVSHVPKIVAAAPKNKDKQIPQKMATKPKEIEKVSEAPRGIDALSMPKEAERMAVLDLKPTPEAIEEKKEEPLVLMNLIKVSKVKNSKSANPSKDIKNENVEPAKKTRGAVKKSDDDLLVLVNPVKK